MTKRFFCIKIFRPIRIREKTNSIIPLLYHWNRRTSEQWCWKNSIDLCCIHEIREKKFFYYQNFSTNQNSRKNQIELCDLLLIGIDGGVNTDPVNIVYTFVLSSKSVTKRFFCIKIFRPIRIREKTNSIIPLLYHWNRRTSEHWCWKNSIDLCCIHEIREKKFFYYQNFSTNQNSRKNQIQLWDLLLIGIDGGANTDPANVVFTFVLSSKSVTKRFFYKNFSTNQNSRKNQIQLWDLLLIEIAGGANTDPANVVFTFVLSSKSVTKRFFYKNFSTNQNSRKNQIQLWDLLLIEIAGGANTDPANVVFTFVLSSKSVTKRFLCIKIFRPIRIREKTNSIIPLLYHWNRRTSEQWCWKNSIDLCCIHEIRGKKIFDYKNFSTNQNSRKNQIELWDLLLIGIDGGANTEPVNVVFTFVLSSKSVTKRYFCIKIFRPIRIRGKMKFNSSTFLPLESTDEWTLMLKKFYCPFLDSRNRWEKIFFVIKILRPIRIREKIKFNYSIFLSLESRDESTLMLRKLYWPLLYSRNPGE